MSPVPKVETIRAAQWRRQVERWREVQHRKWEGIPTEELREVVDWMAAAAFIARGGLETASRLADLLATALVIIERMEAAKDEASSNNPGDGDAHR